MPIDDELCNALMDNNLDKVKEIIEKEPNKINVKDVLGRNLFPYAYKALRGSVNNRDVNWYLKKCEILEFLIESGLEINDMNYLKSSYNRVIPLIYTFQLLREKWCIIEKITMDENNKLYKKIFNIMKLLLEYGADPNIGDHYQMGILHILGPGSRRKFSYEECIIISEEIFGVAKLLLDNGAKPNLKDWFGDTPLHKLIRNGSEFQYNKKFFELIKIFIEKGANVNLKNKAGDFAIDYVENDSFLSKNFFMVDSDGVRQKKDNETKLKIIKLMIENGLDVKAIREDNEIIKSLYCSDLEKRIEELEKENRELRYLPHRPGYIEAMQEFDELAGKMEAK